MAIGESDEFNDFMLDTLSEARHVKKEICVKVVKQHEQKIQENNNAWSHYILGRMYFDGIYPCNQDSRKAFVHLTTAADHKVYEAYWYLSQMYGYRQQDVVTDAIIKLVDSQKKMLKLQLRMWVKAALAGPFFYSHYSLKNFSHTIKISSLAANAYCEVVSKLCAKVNVYKLCKSPSDQLGQHYFELGCLLLYTDVDDVEFAKRIAIRLKMSKIANELYDGNVERDWSDRYDDIKKILPTITIESLRIAGEHGCPAGFYYLRYLYCQDIQLVLSPHSNYHVLSFHCQVEEDRALAFTYLKRAASDGHPMAQYEIIIRGDSKYPYRYLFAGISLQVLSSYLEKLSLYGYKQVLLLCATCYYRGTGFTRDKKKALDSLEEILIAPALIYFPSVVEEVSDQQLTDSLLERNTYGIAGYQSPVPVRCFNGQFSTFDFSLPYLYFLLGFLYERGFGTQCDYEKAASFYRLSYELEEKFFHNVNDHFPYYYGIARGYILLSLCRIGKMIESNKLNCGSLALAESCYRRASRIRFSTDRILQLCYGSYRLGKFYSNPDYEQYRNMVKSRRYFDEVLDMDPNQPDLLRNYCSYYIGKIYDGGLGGGEVNHRKAAKNYTELAGVINAHFHPYCDIYFTYMQQKAKTRIKTEVPLEILRKGKGVIAAYENACKNGTGTIDTIRIIVFGVENVGKTSLMKAILGEDPKIDERSTMNIDTSRSIDTKCWDAEGKLIQDFSNEISLVVTDEHGQTVDTDDDNADGTNGSDKEDVECSKDLSQVITKSTNGTVPAHSHLEMKSVTETIEVSSFNNENKSNGINGLVAGGGMKLLKDVLKRGIAEKLRVREQNDPNHIKVPIGKSSNRRNRSNSLQVKTVKAKKLRRDSIHEQPMFRERKYSLQGGIKVGNERPGTPPIGKEEIGVTFKLWDYCDTFECYTTHLLSRNSIFVLVFNAAKQWQEMIEKRDGTIENCSYLNKICKWLSSINLHTSREEDCVLRNDLSYAPPAIIVIGTHFDEIPAESEEDKKSIVQELYTQFLDEVDDKPYVKHLVCSFIVVNNLKKKDIQFDQIRRLLKDVSLSLPSTKERIPKKWLDVLEHLRELRRHNKAQTLSVLELLGCNEDDKTTNSYDKKETDVMLQYFHDMGEIFYCPHNKFLSSRIVGDIEWLIKSITRLLSCKPPTSRQAKRLSEEWEKLKITGVMSDRYIDKVWPNYKISNIKETLITVMKELDLICRKHNQEDVQESSNNAKTRAIDKVRYYYAPCVMSISATPAAEELYPQDCLKSIWLKLMFKNESIPDITFYRLVTCCLQKWNSNAKLYKNCVICSITAQVGILIKKEVSQIALQLIFRPLSKDGRKKDMDDTILPNGIGISARVYVEKQLIRLISKWNFSMNKQYSVCCSCPCITATDPDENGESIQAICNNLINVGTAINTLYASTDQKIQYKEIDCDKCSQIFSCINHLNYWYKVPDESVQA